MSGGSRNSAAPEPARHRRRALAAGAAAVAVILGGVFFLNRETGTSPAAVESPALSQSPAPPSADGTPTGEAADTEKPADGGSPAAPDPATDPATTPAEEPATEPAADPGAESAPGPAPASDARLATQERPVAAPVEISAGSSESGGVDIRVTAMEAVDGEAQGIGEVAGPAVRFTVSVTNNNDSPLDLSNAVMTVESGADNAPCTPLSGPDAVALPSAVDPGQSATGSYVFLVPVTSRDLVTVYLSYSVDAPVAAFKGAVPTP